MLMSTRKWAILTAVTAGMATLGYSSLYVVPVYQDAILLQFGRVVDTREEPGLYFKLPFVQNVVLIDSRLREWDGESSDLLTVDKENITVNTWARWRVTNPRRFYEALKTESAAQGDPDAIFELMAMARGEGPFTASPPPVWLPPELVSRIIEETQRAKDELTPLASKAAQARQCLSEYVWRIVKAEGIEPVTD